MVLNSKEIARLGAQTAFEKKAQNILILDIGKLLIITDCFVVLSGNTARQVRTISDAIQERLQKRNVRPIGKEGETEGKWVLLDYGNVVFHIFTAEEREYYELERLWRDAPKVEWEEREKGAGAKNTSTLLGTSES